MAIRSPNVAGRGRRANHGEWLVTRPRHSQVSIVPDTGYRAEVSVSSDNSLVSQTRTVYDRRGIRIVVSQGGRVGAFNFQVR